MTDFAFARKNIMYNINKQNIIYYIHVYIYTFNHAVYINRQLANVIITIFIVVIYTIYSQHL